MLRNFICAILCWFIATLSKVWQQTRKDLTSPVMNPSPNNVANYAWGSCVQGREIRSLSSRSTQLDEANSCYSAALATAVPLGGGRAPPKVSALFGLKSLEVAKVLSRAMLFTSYLAEIKITLPQQCREYGGMCTGGSVCPPQSSRPKSCSCHSAVQMKKRAPTTAPCTRWG